MRETSGLHIALVIPHLGGGGAERVVVNLAEGFIGRGHRVDIVVFRTRIHRRVPKDARLFFVEPETDGRTRGGPEAPPGGLIQLPATARPRDRCGMIRALNWDPLCLPGPRLLRQTRAMACYMEMAKPDCVLPSLPRPKTATLLASRLLPDHPPIVPIVHSFVSFRRYRHRRRYRHLLAGAAHLVAVSQGVAASLSETTGIPPERIATIYNPVVATELATRMEEPPDHPWLLDGTTPVILAAGRLSRPKDYPTLIKAFARLAARRPCRLVIIGEGRRRRALEALVARLGLTDRVSLPGWVPNPFAFMSRASLLAMSSRHEGLPTVLVEALACGCPCVSTDCQAGPAEILQGGEFGSLAPVGDDDALARAMAQVLDDPPPRHVLRGRAAEFSTERAVLAYETLLDTVGRPRSPADRSTA